MASLSAAQGDRRTAAVIVGGAVGQTVLLLAFADDPTRMVWLQVLAMGTAPRRHGVGESAGSPRALVTLRWLRRPDELRTRHGVGKTVPRDRTSDLDPAAGVRLRADVAVAERRARTDHRSESGVLGVVRPRPVGRAVRQRPVTGMPTRNGRRRTSRSSSRVRSRSSSPASGSCVRTGPNSTGT